MAGSRRQRGGILLGKYIIVILTICAEEINDVEKAVREFNLGA